jgi:hypothetical protein
MVVLLVALAAIPVPAAAEASGAKRPGDGRPGTTQRYPQLTRLTVVTVPDAARLTVNGKARGRAPLRDLELLTGEHEICASLPLYEDACRTVTLSEPQHTIELALSLKRKRTAVVRSLLLPGEGQRYKGQPTRGWIYTAGAAGAALLAVGSEIARRDAVDDYEAARIRYGAATSPSQIDAAYAEVEAAWDDAEARRKLRNAGWIALGTIWAVSVVDAALGWPARDAGVVVGAAPLQRGACGVVLAVRR